MPPPPILDTAQLYHAQSPQTVLGQHNIISYKGLNSNHYHGHGPGLGISNSPSSNRQGSIQSNNSIHVDNESNNNPLIFSQSNTSYTSFQDYNSLDNSSEIYNLTDYEIGSLDSIHDPVNSSGDSYHMFQNQYFDFHTSSHFSDYSLNLDPHFGVHNHHHFASSSKPNKNLMLKTNFSSQSFSDVSPLNNKYKFENSTPKSSHIPQLTTFHHNPSLPNLRLANIDYDNHSTSSTPIESPIRTPDYDLSKRKKSLRLEDERNSSITSTSSGNSAGGTPGVKKYTRRRLLPRSKNGCWICRIKHLKCDENKPICSTCEKYGITCDYSMEKPDYVIDSDLRNEKLMEISQIRISHQKLKTKKSKRGLRST